MHLKPLSKPWSYVCLILAGTAQPLGLAPFNYWLVGPLSIALILWATQALQPRATVSNKPGFWYGWLFGVGLFGSGASWVYVSIHTYGYASPPLAGALTLALVAGLSLFTALTFWLYFKLRSQNYLKNALLFMAVWTLGDGFRTEFLTGFPWLFLGYGHLRSPLAGWIPVLGVYGLSTVIVATGITVTLVFEAASTRLKAMFAVVVSVIWLSGPALSQISWAQSKGSNLKVAMLQINIPQELKWLPSERQKTFALLAELTEQNWDSDLIIWPETAVPMLYDQALPFLDHIDQRAKEHQSNVITGIPFRVIDDETGEAIMHNSVVSFGNGSGIYHKQKLVPFGEYVPLQDLLRGLIAFFDLPMSDFRTGPVNQELLKSQQYSVAPFICYEVIYPDFVATQARQADYLLTISNDAWFGSSIGPLQHLEMAQMRAAENAKYMVRATNNGISAVIDERGAIITQSEQFVQTVLTSEIKLMRGQTPYSITGTLPLFLLCGSYVLAMFLSRRKARSAGITAH